MTKYLTPGELGRILNTMSDSSLLDILGEDGIKDLHRKLTRFFMSRSRGNISSHDIEDMVQDTFFRLIMKDLSEIKSIEAIAMGIAKIIQLEKYRQITKNYSIDSLSYHRIKDADVCPDLFADTIVTGHQLIDRSTLSPEDALILKEKMDFFYRRFATLTVRQQQAMSLKYNDLMNSKQAAAVMGITNVAVDMLVYRAKERLNSFYTIRGGTLRRRA